MSNDATYQEAMRMLHALAQQHAADDPPSMSRFRVVCAVACAFVAIVFLAINSMMLYRFGYRMGNDEEERIAYALIAAVVPWALALLPFVLMSTWVPARTVLAKGRMKRKRGRPSIAFFAALALYAMFFAANFVGGVGVMATARQKVAGAADDARSEKSRLDDTRKRITADLSAIAAYRPVDEVTALISRQEQHRFWRDTDQCSKREGAITGKAQTKYCADHDMLVAELGRGRKGDELKGKLAAVDLSLSNPIRSTLVAEDAQIPTLARNFRVSEESVRMALPLMWPTLLELGSLMMTYFALKLFRIGHESLVDIPHDAVIVPAARQLTAEPTPMKRVLQAIDIEEPPPTAKPGTLQAEDPVHQREAFDYFWAHRMRRLESAQTPEATIYSHYQALCAQRGVTAFNLATFRRLSAQHVRATVEMNGLQLYCHVLPCEG